MVKKFFLFFLIISLVSCCFDFGSKDKRFKKRVLCAQRVNNENSIRILKEGAFCCPKLPVDVKDITTAKIFYYKKALEIDPQRVDGWEGLAQTCWDGAKYKEAIDYFEKALSLSKNNIRYEIAIISLLRITKDYDKALKHLEELKKIDFVEKERTISYLMGKILYEKGEIKEAISLLEKAKEIYEKQELSHFLSESPYSMDDVYFYLAQCYLKLGDAQKAHQTFLIYLQKEKHPYFVKLYNELLKETFGEQTLLYDQIESHWTRTNQ